MRPIISWIVVADAGQARVPVADGPSHGLNLEREMIQDVLPSREIDSDRPGSTRDSNGRPAMRWSRPPIRRGTTSIASRARSCGPWAVLAGTTHSSASTWWRRRSCCARWWRASSTRISPRFLCATCRSIWTICCRSSDRLAPRAASSRLPSGWCVTDNHCSRRLRGGASAPSVRRCAAFACHTRIHA